MALGTLYHSFLLGLQYTKALYKHYPFVLMMKLFIPKYVYPYINLKKDSIPCKLIKDNSYHHILKE